MAQRRGTPDPTGPVGAARLAEIRSSQKAATAARLQRDVPSMGPEDAAILAEAFHGPGVWRVNAGLTGEGIKDFVAVAALRGQLDEPRRRALDQILALSDARQMDLLKLFGARRCEGPKCGDVFVPKRRKGSRFCSLRCRRRWHKANHFA